MSPDLCGPGSPTGPDWHGSSVLPLRGPFSGLLVAFSMVIYTSSPETFSSTGAWDLTLWFPFSLVGSS